MSAYNGLRVKHSGRAGLTSNSCPRTAATGKSETCPVHFLVCVPPRSTGSKTDEGAIFCYIRPVDPAQIKRNATIDIVATSPWRVSAGFEGKGAAARSAVVAGIGEQSHRGRDVLGGVRNEDARGRQLCVVCPSLILSLVLGIIVPNYLSRMRLGKVLTLVRGVRCLVRALEKLSTAFLHRSGHSFSSSRLVKYSWTLLG